MGVEADYQSSMWEGYYEDFEDYLSDAEVIAQLEWERANTLCTLSGRTNRTARKRKASTHKNDNKFVIVQESRKDDTKLLLVDRCKSKKYWWTHDLSIALTGTKYEMDKVVKKLRYNNPRVISVSQYLE